MACSNKVAVRLKIRNYDNTGLPEITEKTFVFKTDSEYDTLKKEIHEICQVGPHDNKVIKLRRDDEVLVPLSFLLESSDPEKYFYIDVCKINYSTLGKASTGLLQDAYIDSVCQKLRTMESRIERAETLLPHLEWEKQDYVEATASALNRKVTFISSRVDELMPAEWRSKMPQTMAGI